MASSDLVLIGTSDKLEQTVKLCTFCNNSTNGYDKWLHVTRQLDKPFFPVLGQIRGNDTVYDDTRRALVCIACFHHLLRQWSSYERRSVPLQKREYSLIGEEKLSNFQIKREEEIRREAELKLKEIKLREEKIKKQAQERLEHHKRREQQIREEAEKRLLEEGDQLEKITREAERQLKEEKEYEEELKRSLEEDIRLEKEKGEYIRKEAERLLREEILLSSQKPTPKVRTEFLIQSPQGRAYDQVSQDCNCNQDFRSQDMNPSRSKKMEYDPETGCYRRITPLDFAEQKVEDIVQTEMKKSEVKMKLRSDEPAWRRAEDKESGSNPDSSLEDITLEAKKGEADTAPHYQSGETIKTEYKFTMKEEVQNESSPGGEDKNGEFADEDIIKAGEAIKAKFDVDRMKFERETGDVTMSEATKRSYERRRSRDDPEIKKPREDTRERSMSLEKKIKDMEERRARMLRRSSGEIQDNDDAIQITKTITTEDDDNTARNRRLRSREERTRRRLASEGLAPETISNDKPKVPQMKSAGVKLELRGSTFGTNEGQNSFDGYSGHDGASDITFTVKKPADKKDDIQPDEEKVTSYTKTTKTVSVAGSLMDEPNVWSHTRTDDTDDITFTVKDSAHKNDDEVIKETKGEPTKEDRVQEEEVKIEESEPVHSQFSGDPFTQEEPEDIVFTVKKTTTTTTSYTENKQDEPPKFTKKDIVLEERSFNPKTDLLSWEEDHTDSEDKSILKKPTTTTTSYTENKQDEPPKFTKKEIVLEERSFNPKTDLISWEEDHTDSGDKYIFKDVVQPKKREQVIAESSKYKGSLARSELSQDQERRRTHDESGADSTDGYKGSLGRTDINRPVILHDIESDSHEEQPVELQKETQVESSAPETTPMEELSSQDFQAPVIVPRYQDKAADDERRKRQLEIEEKQRQIMEKQKRASVKRRDKPATDRKTEDDTPTTTPSEQSGEQDEDLKEKRRSLLMMWESFADGEGPGPENKLDSEEKRSFGYDKMMMEADNTEPNVLSSGVEDYCTMDVEEENQQPRLIEIDEHHKLNDDELQWERAGQFQPGRLNTKFHDLKQDEPSADDIVFETKKTWKAVNNNEPKETTTSSRTEQRYSYQAPVDEDQSYVVESIEVESAPTPLWDDTEDQTTQKDDDQEEEQVQRKPHVDVDTLNRLTEEEARWERAGQFQPGKINTSVFEGKRNADTNERQGSQKLKKSETSKYEQIQKIQRTNSKKELLVPKKVALRASDNDNSVMKEQDEDERLEIGKIDKSSLIYETIPDEERQRREREERNRREMEEIQREREEERRRQERLGREAVSTVNEFEDDEYDAKVKAKNIRQIDISKFGEFQKTPEPVQERRPVPKTSAKRYSSEIIDTQLIETVESAPPASEEDIFELKFEQENPEPQGPVRKSSVKKQETRTYSQEAPVRKSSVKKEERRTYNEEAPVRKSSVKKEERMYNEEAPVRKSSVKKEERRTYNEEVVTTQTVKEVESAPVEISPEEEYELKRRSVGKLNKDWMSQIQEQDRREAEQRRREAEIQKRKKEQEELEMLRMEETKRRESEGDEVLDVGDKPQNVKKLDSNIMSPFQKVGQSPDSVTGRKKSKDEVRQQRRLARKESRSKMTPDEVLYVEETTEVHQSPETLESSQKNVGKLDDVRYRQMFSEDMSDKERRKKQLEEERVRRELEEMEKQREEEEQRNQLETGEEFSNVQVTEKPQNVSKLDLSQFSQFQQKNVEEVSVKRSAKKSLEKEKVENESVREQETIQRSVVQEVQSAPHYDDDIFIEEKPKKTSVGALDFNHITKSFSSESEEKQRRLEELKRERIRRENEERELLLLEQQRQRDLSPRRKSEDYVVSETTTVEEVQSAPINFEDDEKSYEQSPKKSVRRLDVDKYMNSLNEEAAEKRRRLQEMENERIRREKEEREILLQEQQRQRDLSPPRLSQGFVVSETTVQEVHSAPKYFDEDEKSPQQSPKKNVPGQLDIEKFRKSFNEEAEEKKRRLIEMEKERIRRENEEREILLQEQQRQRDLSPPRRTEDIVVETTDVQEVQSAPVYEEQSRKKSVPGQLNVQKYMKSFSDEAEEKRRRLREMEKERLRREQEEREILLLEQQRQHDIVPSSWEIKDDVIQDVQSVPTDFDAVKSQKESDGAPYAAPERLYNGRESAIERERDEQYSVEEKRKIPGQLNFDNIMQSFHNEEETKQRRAMELEHGRRLRDEEEKQMSRLERRKKSSDASNTVNVSVTQEVQSSPSEDIFFEEKNSRNKPERERRESEKREQVQVNYTDVRSSSTIIHDDNSGSPQNKKSVGKLDLNKFSKAIDQETRERERRNKQLEMERLRLEREEMEGPNVNQSTNSERVDGGDRSNEGQADANDGDTAGSNRPVPRKLDLSKFSAFQGSLRVTKDDSAVKRRDKPQTRQTRPKSIAGTSFRGVANGDIEYRILNQ